MADSVEQIYIKMSIDTKQFDGSMQSIKREMAALRGLVGNSLLSPQEQKALQQRLGTLKNNLDDIKIATNNIDTGDVFGNTARFAGVAANAVAGVTGAMSLLGIESDKVGETEKKILQFMAIGNALQSVADSKRLKALAEIYGQKIKDLFITKELIATEGTRGVAGAVGGVGIEDTSNIAKANAAANVVQLTTIQSVSTAINEQTASVVAATTAEGIWDKTIALTNQNLIKQNGIIKSYEESLAEIQKLIDYGNKNPPNLMSNEGMEAAKSYKDLELQRLDVEEKLKNSLSKKADLEQELQKATEGRNLVQKSANKITEEGTEAIGKTTKATILQTFVNQGFTAGLKAAWIQVKLFTAALFENPIFWFIAAIAAAAAAIYLLAKAFESEESKNEKMNKSLEKTNENLKKTTDEIKNVNKSIKTLEDQMDVSMGNMEERTLKAKNIIRQHFDDMFSLEDMYFQQMTDLTKLYDKGEIDLETYWRKQGEITDRYQQLSTAKAYEKNLKLAQITIDEKNEAIKTNKEKQEELRKMDEAFRAKMFNDEVIAKNKRIENQKKLLELGKKDYIKPTLPKVIQPSFEAFDIEQLYAENDLELSKNLYYNKLTAQQDYYKRKIEIDKQGIRNAKSANQDTTKLEQELFDDMIAKRDDLINSTLSYSQMGLQTLSDFTNTIMSAQLEAMNTMTENSLNALSDSMDKTMRDLDRALKYGIISQETYNREKLKAEEELAAKEKILKTEQAEKEREYAIWQAVMGTANAVLNGLQTKPFVPLGIIMGALAATLGAVQIAAISSAPMPQFELGGMISGPSHQQGGVAINAQGGEYIIKKSVAQRPGMGSYLNNLNNSTSNTTINNNNTSQIDVQTIENIVNRTISGIVAIPVVAVESDSSRVQRKVTTIESRSSW